MYGHGLGSYMEEIMLMKCWITSVCAFVGWLGRPLHSFACKFCIGYDMMQYLLCRHRHRSVQAARVGWLKYTFVREKSCTSDKIEMKSCKFQETASPDVGVGWGNELDISQTNVRQQRYLSVSVSRTPSDWNKTFIWPHFYPAETLEPGHWAHQANGSINSVVTRRSSQCTKCSKISVESCLMDWGIIWWRGFLWILNQIKFLRGQH